VRDGELGTEQRGGSRHRQNPEQYVSLYHCRIQFKQGLEWTAEHAAVAHKTPGRVTRFQLFTRFDGIGAGTRANKACRGCFAKRRF
ncbi:MAG TPA: hypothetical protein VFB27_02160, partial [Opitutaceae bacterium]|nr:hypothetical protein [Opitutaceae bacterium]